MNENVLLIGRDTPFMVTLSERIGLHNLKVHFAQSGPEALDIVQREEIDVVVVNIKELEAEGVRILDSIKKNSPYTECITLTSPSTIHWSIKGMKRGVFADFLIPFDNEDLLAKVREAGTRRKARKRRKKRSLLGKLEDLLRSAMFAESGDFETARQIPEEAKEIKPDNQKEEENEGF